MENNIKEAALRVRELRELNGMSVEELAKETGMSVAEYLELENGNRDFSFTVINKCAQLFKVEVADIMQGSSPTLTTYSVVRKGRGVPIARREDFAYLNMAANFKSKKGEPFWVHIPYVEGSEDQPMKLNVHSGQEVSILISGSAKAQFGNNVEYINEGDVFYFDSRVPHGLIAIGGKECNFFTVIMNADNDAESSVPVPVELSDEELHVPERTGRVYEHFIEEKVDKNGCVKDIRFINEDSFNFAYDVVDVLAKKSPDKLAMLHVDVNKVERRFTFGDISRLSAKAANYFRSLGVQKGDRVMLVLKRHYQFWSAIIALHKLGAIVIPATSQLVQKDFEYRFNAAGVSVVVCTPDDGVPEQIELALAASPTVKKCVIVNEPREGFELYDEGIEKCSDVFPRPEGAAAASGDDLMLMFFTSGTTGYPKIATHSHKYGLGHFITAKYWHNVNPDGLHFTISDTGWGKALWGKLDGAWLCEAAVFTYDFERFNAHDILPMFAQYHITTFCAPPTMYRFMIKEDLSKYDLSSVEHATVAGEALNLEVYNKFLEATGIRLMEGFGQTETTLTVGNFVGMNIKPGSMGKPSCMYDVDIVTPDGVSTAVGEVGEIVVKTNKKTPCGLFRGYYRDDERTLEVWHDGAYHTGDTAWRDEDGYFWYVGRTDDLIKSSGYRIGPFEIESVLMELPYVLECAVTAAPDEIRGQVVKATIVLTKGNTGSEELKKEIQSYVKHRTAPYKYPRIVEFVDELPKTISGKIRRVQLREDSQK